MAGIEGLTAYFTLTWLKKKATEATIAGAKSTALDAGKNWLAERRQQRDLRAVEQFLEFASVSSVEELETELAKQPIEVEDAVVDALFEQARALAPTARLYLARFAAEYLAQRQARDRFLVKVVKMLAEVTEEEARALGCLSHAIQAARRTHVGGTFHRITHGHPGPGKSRDACLWIDKSIYGFDGIALPDALGPLAEHRVLKQPSNSNEAVNLNAEDANTLRRLADMLAGGPLVKFVQVEKQTSLPGR